MASATGKVFPGIFLFIFFSVTWADTFTNIGTPTLFCQKESDGCRTEVGVLANSISSDSSALTFLPQRLNLCLFNDSSLLPEGYDRIISGDRLSRTSMKFDFLSHGRGVDTSRDVCRQKFSSQEDMKFLKEAILKGYYYHWVVDDIPVMFCYTVMSNSKYCSLGLPIGCYVDKEGNPHPYCLYSGMRERDTFYLYNHFQLEVLYSPAEPSSSGNLAGNIISVTYNMKSQPLEIPNTLDWIFPFTVDVTWKESIVKWQNRWDYIEDLRESTHDILVHSLINSCVCLFFLSAIIVITLLKTHPRFVKLDKWLKRNRGSLCKKQQTFDEVVWKELEAEAFLTPGGAVMLAAMCGCAVQILCTCVSTLGCGWAGLLVPANPGLRVKWAMWSYGLSALLAGFVSRHFYHYVFGGKEQNLAKTYFLIYSFLSGIYGLFFLLFFALNLVHLSEGSSAGLSGGGLMRVFSLTVCLPAFCCVVGGVLSALWSRLMDSPHALPESEKNQESEERKPIPSQPFFTWLGCRLLLEGIIPFGCVFLACFQGLSAVWSGLYLRIDGFLLIILLVGLTLAAGVSCYASLSQLTKQNYRWWWRSLLSGAGMSLYYMVYAMYFFMNKLKYTDTASIFLYFGYNFMVATAMFLLVGPLCLMCAYLFLARMYYHARLSRQQEEEREGGGGSGGEKLEEPKWDDGRQLLKEVAALASEGWDMLEDARHLPEPVAL